MSVLEKFKKFHSIDKQCMKNGQHLMNSITHSIAGISETQRNALKNISIAGSVFEGAGLARIFKTMENGELNREMEVDLEYTLVEVPEHLKPCIIDIDEKIGFVKVKYKEELLNKVNRIGWEVEDELLEYYIQKTTDKNAYFLTHKFKDEVLTKVTFKNTDLTVELVLAVIYDVPLHQVSLSRAKQTVKKASVDNQLEAYIDGKLRLKTSWDIVIVFRIMWWPGVGFEWRDRARNWPSQEIIKNLTKCCYIVFKTSDEEAKKEDSLELRYSFSNVERELVKLRSDEQNLVYLIFKCFIYRWLKPLPEEEALKDKISSFLGKNTMLFVCEEYPPKNQLWNTSTDRQIYKTLKFLLMKLKGYFDHSFMPYYFVRDINVIGSIPKDLQQKLSRRILQIHDNIQIFMPEDINDVIKIGEEHLRLITEAVNLLECVNNENQERLMEYLGKRPDLIPQALKVFKVSQKLNDEVERLEDGINDVMKKFENFFNRF